MLHTNLNTTCLKPVGKHGEEIWAAAGKMRAVYSYCTLAPAGPHLPPRAAVVVACGGREYCHCRFRQPRYVYEYTMEGQR